ncbi:MAG: hypothetical protein IJT94_06700 [Oscillibacter sp.]|nr:hypothetical protein [Oscillibacter sp.]
MYDAVITLFNCHERDSVRKWYPTVFSGVTLEAVRSDARSVSDGTVGADTAVVILPTAPDCSKKTASDAVRQYAGPKEYAALADPSGFFTFTPQQDFFVKGDLSGEYPVPVEDEAEDAFHGFYHAINQRRDGVYLVTEAAFFPLIPHFEIGGK